LTVCVSRQLKNSDVGFTGLTTGGPTAMYGTYIPVAAMQLARLTHAPNLTLLLAGWLHNPSLGDLLDLPTGEFPLSWLNLQAEAHKDTWPGMHSMYRGDVTVGFSSAAQIDRFGNMNTVKVRRPDGSETRLIGAVLIPEHLACFGREIVMMPRHERRNFVQDVDYVAAVGHPGGEEGRRRLGLIGSGPQLVVTPRGIFDFDRVTGVMRLRSLNPGSSLAEVERHTGFEFLRGEGVPETPEPSAEELDVLRRFVDPRGFLRRQLEGIDTNPATGAARWRWTIPPS
jgi:glutaconate CoA-transferase subunit B